MSASPKAASLRSPKATTSSKAPDVFGYSPPPEVQLGRDCYKFLQRLDLSIPVKNPRRDLSNGFVVAEILSRFFPADIQMHSYQNGTSGRCKRDNWEQLQRVANKNELQLPPKIVEGTVQGQPGAAVALLELLYEKFTGKNVHKVDPKDLPGMDAAAAAAAAALPALSFGESAAASESGALRAIKSSAGAAVALEFGAVQTQQAGDAAALRRKFAAAGGSSAGGAS
uniref:Calponin-homology (CH) domain-containing protein n=1 Tax=Tetradesmus obliquus TaxID=3088 RepID=A0A383WQE5_TETOB|eukprot:jgi/Sobl393_1/18665/SZX61318.1